MKKEIIVGVRSLEMEVWDFGAFESEKTIDVPEELWDEYLEARLKFETLHDKLGKMAGVDIIFPL